MKIGIVQNKPGLDKKKNLKDILELIPKNDFDILVLPECFNSPYGIEFIKHYAENLEEEGETLIFLNKLSLKYNKSYHANRSPRPTWPRDQPRPAHSEVGVDRGSY